MPALTKYRVRLVRSGALRLSDSAVSCDSAAGRLMRPLFADLPHEEMWLLGLDGQNRPLGLVKVSQGGLHGCAVTPREILTPALLMGASGIILAHNHPSGDPIPSAEDMVFFRRISEAADICGLCCLDSLTITPDGIGSCLKG